ncbi:MAG: S9 family peptidase, partial [Xanthomonadales bacterium]|nr:S9 family peptidase [Xanthomonadales bacterium]
MFAGWLLLAAPLLSASAAAASPAQEHDRQQRFSAERVFDLEYGADPQISPDGKTIVYVRRSMDRLADRVRGDLWTLDVASGAHRPLVVGGAAANAPRWSPDGNRLLYASSSDGRPELRLLYLDSGRSVALAQFEAAPSQAQWSPDGQQIAFTMLVKSQAPSFATPPSKPEGASWSEPVRVFDDITFRFDGQGYLSEGSRQVFTLPASGGTPRQITRGEADYGQPAWLGNKTLLVVGNPNEDRDLDPIESDIFAVDLTSLTLTRLTDRDGPDQAPTPSPDGSMIAYLGYDDALKSWQQTRLYLMDADGSNTRQLAADFDREFSDLRWRADGRALFAMIEDAGELRVVRIDLTGKVTPEISGIGGTSIGRPYAAGSYSLSATRRPVFAYTAAAPDKPADIAVAGGGVEERELTALNDDLLPHLALASIEEIQVPSRHDGLEIEAWVALPPGFEPDGSYPMILEIHGGPFAMYGPTFAAEIQRFAAEGYVTVYVNPRGSTGYGEAFAQAIDLAYPGYDYDDLMSVVDHLIAKQYVSADRLFVTGGSGGGILTAWIVGKTQRFAAAASIKPVINWMTMALAADIAAFVKRHWIRADPWEDAAAFLDRSPIMLVGEVTTPTLVMVGEEDWRTPTWEAEQFYTALKLKGVDTALIRVPGASHSIASRPSRLIAKTDNIMGWFQRYDPG